MRILLTIAGFDPSSGAGITADLMVFAAHGFFGTSAVSALTVQSTVGVAATHPIAAAVLAETLVMLADDLPPCGIKIGMLATEAHVLAVAAFLKTFGHRERGLPVVVDPVVRSSSGRELLTGAGVTALRQHLLPNVDWMTPNRAELEVLTGLPASTGEEVELAARTLSGRYPGLQMVVTGGDSESADDLVLAAGTKVWLRGRKIASRATHGTGCAFSSALLCALVDGLGPAEAAAQAKTYVSRAISTAAAIGQGNGPTNLLWPLTEPG